ncbi:HMCN1 protein, partial [Amia calva]|nr:HMCN1 protein [Amia calva]
VDGGWSRWSPWSRCDRTCGGGRSIRTRSCTSPPPKNGGHSCLGEKNQLKSCNSRACAASCVWSAWSRWSPCSASCGPGQRTRFRSLTSEFDDADCQSEEAQNKPCDLAPCPPLLDGGWTPWSVWSDCPVTCSRGTQIRTRACINPPPRHGGVPCPGPEREAQDCGTTPCLDDLCPWSAWSSCSRSCGAGVSTRRRSCVCEEAGGPGDLACPPGTDGAREQEETQLCYSQPCPGHWTYPGTAH